MNETEQKKQFAMELLHNPTKPFLAAKAVFPNNTRRALDIYALWPMDEAVIDFQAEFMAEEGNEFGLPSQEQLARAVFEVAEDQKQDPETRLKYYKLYGDIRGFIKKPDTLIDQSTHNTQVNNNVLRLPAKQTPEAWADGVLKQQTKLVDDAKADNKKE